jgi:hypothetical protein
MAGKQLPKRPVVTSGHPGYQPVVIHHLSIALRVRSVHENLLNGKVGIVSSRRDPAPEERQTTCPSATRPGSVSYDRAIGVQLKSAVDLQRERGSGAHVPGLENRRPGANPRPRHGGGAVDSRGVFCSLVL